MACKCRHCFGLAEYLEDRGIDSHGLPRASGHPTTLSRATCSGTMTCCCPMCQTARPRVVKRVRQPWEVAYN